MKKGLIISSIVILIVTIVIYYKFILENKIRTTDFLAIFAIGVIAGVLLTQIIIVIKYQIEKSKKKKSSKSKGIKCDLYSVSNSNGKIKLHKLHKAKIIGKNLFISQLQENFSSTDEYFWDEYSFNYSYNIPFEKRIPGTHGKENKLNTKITYEGTVDYKTFNQECYTHLTCWQKLTNSFNFGRLWIQKSSNILWIINMIVALLAILATLASICKSK